MSHQRYVMLAFVGIATVVAWAVQAAAVSGFAQFAYPDNRVLGVVSTSTVLAVLAGAGAFVGLIRNKRALSFADEAVGELAKVTWPTREETVRASTTVVLTAIFAAVLIAVYDLVWKNLADIILFTEG